MKKSCDFTVSTTLWESTADHIAYECGDVQTDIRFYCKGDVNGDGLVSAADAALVIRYDAGRIDLSDAQLKAADMDGDDQVTTMDAKAILRYVASRMIR